MDYKNMIHDDCLMLVKEIGNCLWIYYLCYFSTCYDIYIERELFMMECMYVYYLYYYMGIQNIGIIYIYVWSIRGLYILNII